MSKIATMEMPKIVTMEMPPPPPFDNISTVPLPSVKGVETTIDTPITNEILYDEVVQPTQLRLKAGKIQILVRRVATFHGYAMRSRTKGYIWRDIPEVPGDTPDWQE